MPAEDNGVRVTERYKANVLLETEPRVSACMKIFQTMVLEIHRLVTIIEAAYYIIYLVL